MALDSAALNLWWPKVIIFKLRAATSHYFLGSDRSDDFFKYIKIQHYLINDILNKLFFPFSSNYFWLSYYLVISKKYIFKSQGFFFFLGLFQLLCTAEIVNIFWYLVGAERIQIKDLYSMHYILLYTSWMNVVLVSYGRFEFWCASLTEESKIK